MKSAVAALVAALFFAAVATPLVRRFALYLGAVDQPGGRRVHAGEIPRLGGLALVFAFFGSLFALFALDSSLARLLFAEPMRVAGLAAGALMIAGLGVADDLRGVRALHKLAIQCLAATVVFYAGFRIEAISLPGLGTMQMGVFALPVTVLWIATVVNALNLIDGLDGLAAGIAFFAAMTNFIVSLIHHDLMVMLLSAALAGAVLGFLLYNFNPATIFMGDSGSMFLGFILATTALLGHSVKSSTSVAILAPLIALGVPIMDTLLAIVRRYLERRPIFSADRGHIHHRLLDMGLTHRRAVLSLYGLSALFCAVAIVISLGSSWEVGSALIFCVVAMIGMVRVGGYMRRRVRSPAGLLSRSLLRESATLFARLEAANDAAGERAAFVQFCEGSGLASASVAHDTMGDVLKWGSGTFARGEVEAVPVALPGGWTLRFGASAADLGVEEEAALLLIGEALQARVSLEAWQEQVTPMPGEPTAEPPVAVRPRRASVG